MYFLLTHYKENFKQDFKNKSVNRFIGIYFLVIAVMFYLLWLSEIVPSIIQKTTPKSVTEAGLFTNGVHVIDLAVFLPAIFITGIFLLKRKSFGFVLTPVLLTFFVLMDITIGTLVVLMKIKGLEAGIFLSAIMGALALISLLLLTWYFKSFKLIIGK